MRTVLMFAGQGTQYPGMGRGLWDGDAAYRAAMERCDAACGPIGGETVSRLALRRRDGAFDRQAEVTPALLAVGVSLAAALAARGVCGDVLLGSSFGETIASVVAGSLSLEAGFALVRAQAEVVEATVPPGGMVAVLGAWDVLRLLPEVASCTLAAVNSPRHFVLAGGPGELDALDVALRRREVAFQRLPVRFAFHSAAVEPARTGLLAAAGRFPRAVPRVPVMSSLSAASWDHRDAGHFWKVAREPIRFAEAVRAVAAAGPCRFVEAGPSGSLATFVRQVLGRGVDARAAMGPLGDNLRMIGAIPASG